MADNDLFPNVGETPLFDDSAQGTGLFSTPAGKQKAAEQGARKVDKELTLGVKSKADIAFEAALKRTSEAPEDTIFNRIGNLAKGAAAEGAFFAGEILKAPGELISKSLTKNVTPQDEAMYAQIRAKDALGADLTAEETQFKNRQEFQDRPGIGQVEQENSFQRLRKAEGIKNFTDIVDQGVANARSIVDNREKDVAIERLTGTAEEAAEQLANEEYGEAIGTFLGGVKDLAVKDTGAAVQMTAETLPVMIGLATSALISVPSLAIGEYDDAIASFEEEHGRAPDEAEKQIAAGLSLVSVGLDAVGAKFLLGSKTMLSGLTGVAGKTGLKVGTDTLKSAKAAVNRVAGTAAGKIVTSAGKVASKPATSAVVEGGTEGAQNVLSQLAGKQDVSKIDAAEALVDTAIGAVIGVGIGAPRTAADVVGATAGVRGAVGDKLSTAVQVGKGKVTKAKVAKAAAKSKAAADPTELINLVQDSDFAGQPEETRLQSIDQMNDVLDTAIENVADIKDSKDRDTSIKKIQEATNIVNALVATHNSIVDAEAGLDVTNDIDQVIGEDPTADVPTTIDRILGSKQADSLLTETKLRDLLGSNTIKNASPEQVTQLEERFVHEQRKNSTQVGKEFMEGSTQGEFKGIRQYHAGIQAAIVAGNQDMVTKELKSLGNLAKSQRVKLNKLLEAWSEITNDQGTIYEGVSVVIPDFSATTPKFTVNSKSENFIKKVANETNIAEAEYAILSEQAAEAFAEIEAPAPVDTTRLDQALEDVGIEPIQVQTQQDLFAEEETTPETAQPETETEADVGPEIVADVEATTTDTEAATATETRPADELITADRRQRDGFLDPEQQAIRDWELRTKQQGLSPEQTAALAPEVPRDNVTGFFEANTRTAAVKRGWDYVSQFGSIGSYVDIDLRNLGGLNNAFTHRGANTVYRAFADIVYEKTKDLGDVVHIRHGGDEMSIIAPTVDPDTMKAALEEAVTEIQTYVEANNLQDIPHAKYSGYDQNVQDLAKGTGIYFGIALLDPDYANSKNPLGDQAGAAEARTEASKPKEIIKLAEQQAQENETDQTDKRPEPLTLEETRALDRTGQTEPAGTETPAADTQRGETETVTPAAEPAPVAEAKAVETQPGGEAKRSPEAKSKAKPKAKAPRRHAGVILKELRDLDPRGLSPVDAKTHARLIEQYQTLIARVKKNPDYRPADGVVAKLRKAADTVLKNYKDPETEATVTSHRLLQGGLADPKTGLTLSSMLTASGKKLQGFIHTIPNVMGNLSDPAIKAVTDAAPKEEVVALRRTLKFVQQFGKDLSPLLKRIAKPPHPGGKDTKSDMEQDPFSYFIQVDEKGNRFLDPNLVTAMGLAGFNWLATQGNGTLFNNADAINRILGRPTSTQVSSLEFQKFATVGFVRNFIADSIGSEVYSQLGLKAKTGTDGSFEANLKNSIGQAVISTLWSQGLLEQRAVEMHDGTVDLSASESTFDPNKPTNFIKMVTIADADTGGRPTPEQDQRREDSKVGKPLVEKFVEVADHVVKPSLSQPKPKKHKLQGTDQDAPGETENVIRRMEEVKWETKSEMIDLVEFLGEDLTAEIMGYVKDVDDNVHVSQRDSVRGKNRGILTAIQNMFEFEEDAEGRPFYFQYVPWRNNRIGDTSNTVSLQNSKLHRHVFGAQAWNVTIDPSNPADLAVFALAISAAFGEKIDTPTALHDAGVLLDSLVNNNPRIANAITAVKAITEGTSMTLREQETVREAIRQIIEDGGEAFHTLDGLVALSKFTPNAPFETNLALETDGKTNGVIIGHMQSMTSLNLSDKLAAGNVFVPGQNPADKRNDSYQSLAAKWHAAIEALFMDVNEKGEYEGFLNEQAAGINQILGDLVIGDQVQDAARKLTKNPLMITSYGASVDRVVSEFTAAILDNVYDQMVKASKLPEGRNEALQTIENSINQIMGTEPSSLLAGKTHKEILEFQMPTKEEAAFRGRVDASYGEALRMALDQEFSGFTEFRRSVNESMNVVFDLFEERYDVAVDAREAELGRELSNQEKRSVAKELIDSQPVFRGPFSDGIADSIVSMRDQLKTSYLDEHTIQQSYTKKLPVVDGKPVASTTGHSRLLKLRDGGVSSMILAIQSIDSAVNQTVLKGYDALNMHDAVVYGLSDAVQGTKDANQAFYEVNRDYHILEAVNETFSRVMGTMTDQERKDVDSKLFFKSKAPAKFKPTVASIQDNLTQQLKISQAARKEFYDNPSITNQYTLAGAEYHAEGAAAVETHAEEVISAIEGIFDNLKSAADADINVAAFAGIDGLPITPENTVHVFDGLSHTGTVQDPAAHTNYLRDMMAGIVSGALAPLQALELKLHKEGTENVGMLKDNTVFVQVGNQGVPPVTALSAQEVYAHEMVHAITRHGIDNNYGIRRKILQIYKEAERSATMEDFLPRDDAGNIVYGNDPAATRASAQARYEYIFKNTQQQKRQGRAGTTEFTNNYLHEFVAFGMTNAEFRAKLADVDATPVRSVKDGTIAERITAAFNNVVDWISNSIHKTKNLKGDEALTKLVQELTDIHERKRAVLLKIPAIPQQINEPLIRALDRFIWQPAMRFKARHKNSKNVPIRAANTVLGVPGALSSPEGHKVIEQVSRNIGITEKFFITQLARELIGPTLKTMAYHNMLRFSKKYIDQNRKHLSDEITEEIVNTFQEPLNKMDSTAVNKAGLKTDLVTLFDQGKTANEIMELLQNQSKLDAEIAQVKADITTKYGNDGNYYINQARGLGHWMAQGVTPADGQQLNATRIASMAGVPNTAVPKRLQQRIEAVDMLASLFALDRTTVDMRSRMARLMATEYTANGSSNGISHTMDLHRNFKNEALQNLFHGNPMLMIKGYTQETFNSGKAIKVATKAEGEQLAQEGYKDQGPLAKDPKDPTGEVRHLYVSDDQQTMTYVKSIVSLTNEIVKGHTLADAYKAENSESSELDAVVAQQQVEAAEDLEVASQFTNPNHTRGAAIGKMIPISDDAGKTVGYRYTMGEHQKDTLLEKDNRFERVMGKMYGSVVDKVNSQYINDGLVKLAKDDFDQGFANDPRGYVEVSNSSVDPHHREIYALMPKDMKQAIKREWGNQPMMVRADLVNLIFGYRKYSITDSKLMPQLVKPILKQLEGYWQEGIGMAKDNIVIKNGTTLAGNIMSNTLLLYTKGVPVENIVKDQATALSALNEFMDKVKEKNRLARLVKVTQNMPVREKKDVEAEISRLEDDLATNPVKELIDEGIFQTISEDINLVDDDIYSKKTKLLNKLDPAIDKVPPFMLSAYKWGYFTHDTPAYKLLLRGTQYSDFVARFALYKHLTDAGKTKGEALAEIIETFINYDIPTSKGMQYMNDMGFFMFTKFLFRIQRVILRVFKEKPATTLSVYTLQEMFGEVSDIGDSFLPTSDLIGRFNNPMELADAATYVPGLDHATSILGVDNPLE